MSLPQKSAEIQARDFPGLARPPDTPIDVRQDSTAMLPGLCVVPLRWYRAHATLQTQLRLALAHELVIAINTFRQGRGRV